MSAFTFKFDVKMSFCESSSKIQTDKEKRLLCHASLLSGIYNKPQSTLACYVSIQDLSSTGIVKPKYSLIGNDMACINSNTKDFGYLS